MCAKSNDFNDNFATEESTKKLFQSHQPSQIPLQCSQCPKKPLVGAEYLLEQLICNPDIVYSQLYKLIQICDTTKPLPFSNKEPLLLVCTKLRDKSHNRYSDLLDLLVTNDASGNVISIAIRYSMTFMSEEDTYKFLTLCNGRRLKINMVAPNGTTPLHLLVKSASNKSMAYINYFISFLISHGCDVNRAYPVLSLRIPYDYPVHMALQIEPSAKAINVLDCLITHGADISVTHCGQTILHVICEKIRQIAPAELSKLHKLTRLIDYLDSDGYKPVWTAAAAQNELMVHELVKLGAKLDGFDRFGRTIAQYMVFKAPGHFCNAHVYKHLLGFFNDHNVNLNHRDKDGNCLILNILTIKLSDRARLCSYGANDSPSCFHDLVEYLLALGVNFNSFNNQNETVLEVVAKKAVLSYDLTDILYAFCKHAAKVETITGKSLPQQNIWTAIWGGYKRTEWSKTYKMSAYQLECQKEIERMKVFPVRDTKTLFLRHSDKKMVVDVSFLDFLTSNSLEMAKEIMKENTFERRFTEKVLVKLFPIYGVLLYGKTRIVNKIVKQGLKPSQL